LDISSAFDWEYAFKSGSSPHRKDVMTMLTSVAPTHEKTKISTPDDSRELIQWQRQLLPFMTRFIVVMAAAFFVFSGIHIYQVTRFIQMEDGQNIRSVIQAEIARPTGLAPSAAEITEHSLLLLEADALDRRYHQAGGLLMSRIWSRQLTFITGMVMAFVGAVFVLGKLSESTTEASGGAGEWRVAISSASPGIILSFFGTVLLVASLFVSAKLDVYDGPAYINAVHFSSRTSTPAAGASSKPDAPPLDRKEMERLDADKKEAGSK
jgi:hypothetical protein